MLELNKEDYFFSEEDYDTFKLDFVSRISGEVKQRRLDVQEKLLELNKDINIKIAKKGYDLHNHSNPKNITSLLFPCQWNKGRVDWIGVRYGRSKEDIDKLNYGLSFRDSDSLGFQKYACMQINISYTGVDAGIFHAVPFKAVDRNNLHFIIYDEEFQKKLIAEIEKIRGYGFIWHIGDGVSEDKEFNFDTQPPIDFIKFYEENDFTGSYSSVLYHFPRWDSRLKKENIVDSTFEILEKLYDFYKVLIWKGVEK